MRADQRDDILLDLCRLKREALGQLAMKMASQQLGEDFLIEDRREITTIKRGPQRRRTEE